MPPLHLVQENVEAVAAGGTAPGFGPPGQVCRALAAEGRRHAW